MNDEMKKEALSEEKLEKVSGGARPSSEFIFIPDYCEPVQVRYGENNSVLCPYDGTILREAPRLTPLFAEAFFCCGNCSRWFSKTEGGEWYVSEIVPL